MGFFSLIILACLVKAILILEFSCWLHPNFSLSARQFDTDLSVRKSSIKVMIQEELTKLADEADEEEDGEDAEKDEPQSAGEVEA